jgi:DNA-binding HxlR family transcriptional regulator
VYAYRLDPNCSIARSLGVLGERWTFLILREAMDGVTRFAQFRDVLGIAPDVLTDRLTTLVEYGVMSRAPYQEPGSRTALAGRVVLPVSTQRCQLNRPGES